MRPTLLIVLSLSLFPACQEYDLKGRNEPVDGKNTDDEGLDVWELPEECVRPEIEAERVGQGDVCDPVIEPAGGFTPVVEWTAGAGRSCSALPAVADLDLDGRPEIIANFTPALGIGASGDLVVLEGDGSGQRWRRQSAKIGYGSGPTVADILGNKHPEILVVREIGAGLGFNSDYYIVAFDWKGNEIWQSAKFTNMDFDYATGISVSDMDHDGSPEIVAGRVILNADGSTRGVGAHGRGSYGITNIPGVGTVSESSLSAIADLDLNGTEEVIVGNAIYDADGTTLWFDNTYNDGMIAIANLDNDEYGEFLAVTGNTIRAVNTNGSILWGPKEIPSGNILSVPAVGDIDVDGDPDVVVAGGNKLWALDGRTGKKLWTADVTDESGATGASIFDFEGDGIPEVVYIDEVEMVAYDGQTGEVKFYNDQHASATMMDYPVIADVDGDDHAEIVVCHMTFGAALSVYGDQDNSWVPARGVWNQHAYSIDNINDDLSVPVNATPGFTTHNTWHAAIDKDTIHGDVQMDLEAEIIEVCDAACSDEVPVVGRVLNKGPETLPVGIVVSLYTRNANGDHLVGTQETTQTIKPGKSGEPLEWWVPVDTLTASDALWMVVDDDGTGTGAIDECAEFNNGYLRAGPFCQ